MKSNLLKYNKFIFESQDPYGGEDWNQSPGQSVNPLKKVNTNDDDYEYLKRMIGKEWYEEEAKDATPGDRVVYRKEGSEHNGKNGIFTEIREDGRYRITFDDGKKLVADSKNVFRVDVRRKIEDLPPQQQVEKTFKMGQRIIYINPESEHDGESGVFLSVRGDGKFRIEFDNGIKLAASPQFVQEAE